MARQRNLVPVVLAGEGLLKNGVSFRWLESPYTIDQMMQSARLSCCIPEPHVKPASMPAARCAHQQKDLAGKAVEAMIAMVAGLIA